MITKLKLCQPCLAEFLSIYFLFTKQVCLLGMTPFMAFRLTVYPNRSDRYSVCLSVSPPSDAVDELLASFSVIYCFHTK